MVAPERVAVQFRLVSMLLVMAAASVLFALIFTAHGVITFPVLIVVLWVSPSVWIAGIIYARGWSQAFFIGGLVAGAIPFLIVATVSGTMTYAVVASVDFDDWTTYGGLEQINQRPQVIYYSLVLLSPGFFSFLGGLLAVVVYGMNRRVT